MKSAIQFKLETAGLDEREAKVLDFIPKIKQRIEWIRCPHLRTILSTFVA